MTNFADRLVDAVGHKGNPCVVGLDPRVDQMPRFVIEKATRLARSTADQIRTCIRLYHQMLIDALAPMVPAVKLQIAFYEQYGVPGIEAFRDTIVIAKERGLLVLVDAKRNDIASTAQAYANALLGETQTPFGSCRAFDVDCITISPYLGEDSLLPFVETCRSYGKGVFVLVKTSNPGSRDLQDLMVEGQRRLYEHVSELVARLGSEVMGDSGYSSIGAVVGATFPAEADLLRARMPRAIFLVPGYGAQGGTGQDAAHCFNADGLGAVVNASRSISYGFDDGAIDAESWREAVRSRLSAMIQDVCGAVAQRRGSTR